MAIAPEALEAGAGAAGAGEGSAVKASGRMPRQPGYLTRKQVGSLRSDQAEYEDMQRREAGGAGSPPRPRRPTSARPARNSSGGGGRSSGGGKVASQAIRSATRGRTPIVTKLFYALFAGLVALELGSMATGRRFKIQVPRPGGGTGYKKPVYEPYFTGQGAAPAQTGATSPGPSNPFISNVSAGPLTTAVADSGLGHAASYFTPAGSGFVAQDVAQTIASHPAQAIGFETGVRAGLHLGPRPPWWPSWLPY